MCGIVGHIGQQEAVPILLNCVKRLEYRGYDSAGIGVIDRDRLEVRRALGKIANLERVLPTGPIQGRLVLAGSEGHRAGANARRRGVPLFRGCSPDRMMEDHRGTLDDAVQWLANFVELGLW